MNQLTPYEFDQTDAGWRLLDAQGRYVDAARSLEDYIAAKLDVIAAQQEVSLQTMHFHAGQEYAMAGQEYYTQAIEHFAKSYKSKRDWDTYVDGTIAFLNGDIDALQQAAESLDELSATDGTLSANARLLKDFAVALARHATYAQAYDEAAGTSLRW